MRIAPVKSREITPENEVAPCARPLYHYAPMNDYNRKSLDYAAAGVDIDAGNRLVERIKPVAAATRRTGVMGGLGGFGALFDLGALNYHHPVLVTGTDGVGTKLKLAQQLDDHSGIGIDLVAMCVNDLIVQGAEPLMFLDYYASAALDVDTAAEVVAGIGRGCELAGAALVGGETAEMPGLYAPGDYDLAGFCVGVVEREAIIDGSRVAPGDSLIGIASSGPHSNGYSLIRKVLEVSGTDLKSDFHGRSLGATLLEPTRIYVRAVLQLLREGIDLHALAHITGGGLPENLPRVMPAGTRAYIDGNSWDIPPVFTWLQQQGRIETAELYRTFNCGVGMVLVVAAGDAARVIDSLKDSGEQAWALGRIEANPGEQAMVTID